MTRFLCAILVSVVFSACGDNIRAGDHNDGFGHSWDDGPPSGTYTTAQAQTTCKAYRQAVAQEFAHTDAGVEDQTPDVALNYLCEPIQDANGTVTQVCTHELLKPAESLNWIDRKTCWLLDGGITINDEPTGKYWY